MSGLLRTTMVGAYPRPAWYRDQLEGRDIREAFKVIHREEAFRDAVGAVIADQQAAGPRHRHRRPDVVRRLRDGDRRVPLVLVRAHRRLRAREARAPGPGQDRTARTPSPSTRPAASRCAGRSSAARCGWPSSTRSPPARPTGPSRPASARVRCSCRRWRTSRRARSRTATTSRPRSPTSSAPRSTTSSRRAAATSSSRTSARGSRTSRAPRATSTG